MRKFTLLLITLSFAVLGVAQNLQMSKDAPLKQEQVSPSQDLQTLKSGGDVFWSTTFDWSTNEEMTEWQLPEGWSIVDNTDFGMPWVWRSPYDTLGGNWTWQGPSPGFDTPLDGYICVPANEYNYRDEIITDNLVDTYIMTPPIDCSEQSSVVVKYNQLFRTCCPYDPVLVMEVTNDAGVHWAQYSSNFGLSNNRVTDLRYRTVEFNISDVAAGMSNVQIKFYWSGSQIYYWMIDDLRLCEAYENEIVLEDYWAEINMDFDERMGHINYMPLSQMGMVSESALGGHIGDYEFSGAVLNNGMADQYDLQLQMTIQKNGEQVFRNFSDATDLWSLDRDTLTATEVFLADDYGDYSINFAAISENAEEVPHNNFMDIMFTVTDSLYHRGDFSTEGRVNSGGWVGGANAGDMIGVFYDIFETTEISSITGKVREVIDEEFPEFQYVLLKNTAEDGIVEWLTTEIIPADSTMVNTWVTLDVDKDGETEFLEPGEYIVAARFWGDDGTEEGSNGMGFGWDKDNRADSYTYIYVFVDEAWWNPGKMAQIGMVLNEHGGPTDASVTFNVDMNAHIQNGEFSPDTDFVDVAGTFNDWNGSDALSDVDGDGIYSITMENLPVAQKIEYKYRINADWETSEFPDGGPNRNYTVRYWNVLNDVYNNGATTGVKNIENIDEFEVFPNPNNGRFTLRISSSESTDVAVKLLNLQGKVVYNKIIQDVYEYTEVINETLVKGLYFLSVETSSGVKTQKIVVK